METFEFSPKGYFNLVNQSQFFDNCASLSCQAGRVVVSFPVEEDWHTYALVALTQTTTCLINAEVIAENGLEESAFKQALSMLSLDIDGSGFAHIGQKDPIIGKLQKKYNFVRPGLFHSPYEAAVAFVIGNRMSIRQRKAIMIDIAEKSGKRFEYEGQNYFAFPSPYDLLKLEDHPSLNTIKINRLHNIANAAIDGILVRKYLRSLPIELAISQIKSIPGIGEFYAQGILYRGAGIVDDITSDDLTFYAIQKAYGLEELPDKKEIAEISANWAPYKMWCNVLLHIWLGKEVGLHKTGHLFQKRQVIKTGNL